MATAETAKADPGFDLLAVIHFFWRQWKFIAAITSIVLLIAAVNLAMQVPRYTATSQVLLDPRKEKTTSADAVLADMSLDQASIASQMAIITSTVFLKRVVERQHLVSDPEFGFGGPKIRRFSILGTLFDFFSRSSAEPKPTPVVTDRPTSDQVLAMVEALKGAITVTRGGIGYILGISVTSVSPDRAATLANAVADTYIVDQLDARFDATQRASNWLSDRLTDLRTQLRTSEEAVAKFRTEHGIAISSTVTLNQQQLSDLNGRLITARAETGEKKARLDLLKSIEAKGGNALNLPDVANVGTLGSLRQRESESSPKIADLAARYSNSYPLVINARAELGDIQRAIAAETKRVSANINNEYQLAKAREESLEQSLQQVTGQTNLDNDTTIKLRELERTAAVNKSLFEDYLRRAKVTEEQSTFASNDVRIISPATVPFAPSYPSKSRTMSIALFIGLLLGGGGAYAKELLNSGFTTPRQVEDLLKIPLLASVSRIPPRDLTIGDATLTIPHYIAARPLSRYSEAIRSLRSGVQMTDVDNPPKVVQITSTVPSEGKTTISLSVAASAANSGLKVLFIDADLRHPSASNFFGIAKESGLVDLLLGQISASDAIKYNEDLKIWVLPAGSKSQNPPDLLGSERMKSLISNFKSSFDYVVIDSPPLGPVIDSAVISQLADKVIYVVYWARTAREMVEQSMQKLNHKKVAGIVFNNVDDSRAIRYGKYAYSYYYGAREYKRYYSG
jgi:exopolysaccharide transport family protein